MASSYNEWPINKDLVSVEVTTHPADIYTFGIQAGRSGQHREVRKVLLPDEVQEHFPNYQGGALVRWDAFSPYRGGDNMVLTSLVTAGLLVVEVGCRHEYTMHRPHYETVDRYDCTKCGHFYTIDHGD